MSEHIHPNYVKIWATLLVLLVISIAGPMLEIPTLTLITAFGIAVIKAFIVVAYFMHLNIEKRFVWYLLGTMLTLLLVFFAGIAPDVLKYEGQNWVNSSAVAHTEGIHEAPGHGNHHENPKPAEHH